MSSGAGEGPGLDKAGRVLVSGPFDDLRPPAVRFLQEAARLGGVEVALWSDDAVLAITGRPPRFPLEERRYVLAALRYVRSTSVVDLRGDPEGFPPVDGPRPAVWAVAEGEDTARRHAASEARGVALEVVPRSRLGGFPLDDSPPAVARGEPGRPLVVVTGCYDWLHSGHVRFFEEVSALGELAVVIGSDANVRRLKGEGHPLFNQEERRYMVGSVRLVRQALVATGWGWLDAEPEIQRLRPDIYAVNRDGDRPEKREFCAARGIRYVVLERTPRPGLPRRSSTDLRGF